MDIANRDSPERTPFIARCFVPHTVTRLSPPESASLRAMAITAPTFAISPPRLSVPMGSFRSHFRSKELFALIVIDRNFGRLREAFDITLLDSTKPAMPISDAHLDRPRSVRRLRRSTTLPTQRFGYLKQRNLCVHSRRLMLRPALDARPTMRRESD
jgi:hypothetical protein